MGFGSSVVDVVVAAAVAVAGEAEKAAAGDAVAVVGEADEGVVEGEKAQERTSVAHVEDIAAAWIVSSVLAASHVASEGVAAADCKDIEGEAGPEALAEEAAEDPEDLAFACQRRLVGCRLGGWACRHSSLGEVGDSRHGAAAARDWNSSCAHASRNLV